MPHRRIVIDHVELRVRDLEKACAFYQTVLAPLGFSLVKKTNSHASFGKAGSRDDFGLNISSSPSQNLHIAFAAESTQGVDAFYAEALKNGARNNGPPGHRGQYHAGYYGAFVLDDENNNIEAVYHGYKDGGA